MFKLLSRLWHFLIGRHDPILLTLPRVEGVQKVDRLVQLLTAPLPEPPAPVKIAPKVPLTLEMKMFETRNKPGHIDELMILCHEASLNDLHKLLTKVVSQDERQIVQDAIEHKTLISETADERLDRLASELQFIPDAIIEPSGPYFGRIQGDPNHTVDQYPHADAIPQSCKPPKAPTRA